MKETLKKIHHHGKKAWNFLWNDDSLSSWIANIIVAFLVIRFIIYPVLGLLLGTSFPIVAVVSESMEHGLYDFVICGEKFYQMPESFDNYWKVCGSWYEQSEISKEQFQTFPFQNGFNKGDVIILWRANSKNLEVGDILIFQGTRPQPIIHRIVKIWKEDGQYYYQTKGDHNQDSGVSNEEKISVDRIYGQGILRIPYLGWLKIWFVDAVRPLGWNIQK